MKKALFILIIILVGCNAEKKAARQDEKAWNRYSTSPKLIQRSVPLVSALFPCIVKEEIVRTDTSFLYITDTLVKKIPYAVYKDKVLDTIINNISIFQDSTGISVKYLGKDKVITKTIEKVKIDQSEANRLTDSLNKYRVIEAGLNGKYLQLEKHTNEVLSDKTKWQTYFWILVAAIGIALGGFLYIKFKIPLK